MGNQASTAAVYSMIEKLYPESPDPVLTRSGSSYYPGSRGESSGSLQRSSSTRGTDSRRPMGILSFEIAAAMLRASELWDQMGSTRLDTIRQSLECEGTCKLVKGSMEEKWALAALEKRRELRSYSSLVSRLGKRCTDPRVQVLGPTFDKLEQPAVWRLQPQQQQLQQGVHRDAMVVVFQPKEEEALFRYLDSMVISTNTLHSEMAVLDNLLPSSHPLRLARKSRDAALNGTATMNGLLANALQQEKILAQLKEVTKLQQTSLWVQEFQKSVQLLSLTVFILWRRYHQVFPPFRSSSSSVAPSSSSSVAPSSSSLSPPISSPSTTLGHCGLSLHYAHTLTLIHKAMTKPITLLRANRDDLYNRLPSNIKSSLRFRLSSRSSARVHRVFDAEAAAEIRRTMEYMLNWLMPLAQRTLTWQSEHSYGCHLAKRNRTMLVQTLYYADKEQFEMVLLELLVGLSYITRPPGPGRKMSDQEEASWKAWVASSTGHPLLPPAAVPGGAQRPGTPAILPASSISPPISRATSPARPARSRSPFQRLRSAASSSSSSGSSPPKKTPAASSSSPSKSRLRLRPS